MKEEDPIGYLEKQNDIQRLRQQQRDVQEQHPSACNSSRARKCSKPKVTCCIREQDLTGESDAGIQGP